MTTQSNDISTAGIDARSLAPLITELNIARRTCHAYPKGHPLIDASMAKVLSVYEVLLNRYDAILLGVTSDALMVDGVFLDKSNIVYRDFSRVLFERGIGALRFHSGLTVEELRNFTVILGLKREQIKQHGGIEEVWAKAGITAISVQPVRYDLLKATDDESVTDGRPSDEALWDRFARELSRGELPGGDSGEISLDPEILAEVINQQFARGDINETALREIFADFLASASAGSASETLSDTPYRKAAAFISNLTPELRRQFLESSFGAKSQNRHAAAEWVLSDLSETALLETLKDINQNRLNVSPVVFGLLQRLGQNAGLPRDIFHDPAEDNDLARKMKTIFREHASEEFVPDDYQKKLDHIIASDQIPRLNMEEVTDLLKTLESRAIESGIGQILMDIIRQCAETPEERNLLLQNISDMFGYFLQTGDYGQLHKMIDQLADTSFPDEIRSSLRNEYSRHEFLDEILNGLSIWGKPRYEDIRSLIHKIGAPFVEALLDRLSEEKNMSLRRFYMDCLIEMGPVTREPIANRLYDKRWYFLRNLLLILTAQNDPSVVTLIRPLLRRDDPRLRNEVLKTLVHFHDPHAEKLILDDLDSQNPELQTAAIQLAERCSSPAVSAKLAGMVSQGGFSPIECERKSAIVHALAEIGRAEVLPELAKILRAQSLIYSRHLTKLKTDIISSLPKYPPRVSRPVLERIAEGSTDIARLAAETLKIISGKSA